MDLEQIVKETVAKIIAEKTLTTAEKKKKEDIVMAMKKDFKGPKSAMYAIATDKAKKLAEEFDFVRSAIESASGDKISHTEEDDYGRTIYWSTKNPNVNYFVGMGGEFEGKIYLYNGETGERYPIGDLKHYGDGQNHAADDDMHESQDISDDELAQLQSTADDTSKMPAERDAARNKIYASRAKKEQQELEEFMIRRWQYYAGIK
jgi:hypothetical protein